MRRHNFIDWNGNGSLDPQDLVTGVTLDAVEEDEQNQLPPKPDNAKQAVPGCGCALTGILLLAGSSFVALSLVLLF